MNNRVSKRLILPSELDSTTPTRLVINCVFDDNALSFYQIEQQTS